MSAPENIQIAIDMADAHADKIGYTIARVTGDYVEIVATGFGLDELRDDFAKFLQVCVPVQAPLHTVLYVSPRRAEALVQWATRLDPTSWGSEVEVPGETYVRVRPEPVVNPIPRPSKPWQMSRREQWAVTRARHGRKR